MVMMMIVSSVPQTFLLALVQEFVDFRLILGGNSCDLIDDISHRDHNRDMSQNTIQECICPPGIESTKGRSYLES